MSSFKEFPRMNPKTNEETKLFICSICGAITPIRKLHLKWHKEIDLYSSIPYWKGVDDE